MHVQGKNSDTTVLAKDVDVFKLSSLHAQYKKKIRATIQELQEEQDALKIQKSGLQGVYNKAEHLSHPESDEYMRDLRQQKNRHQNTLFLLLQEIMYDFKIAHRFVLHTCCAQACTCIAHNEPCCVHNISERRHD